MSEATSVMADDQRFGVGWDDNGGGTLRFGAVRTVPIAVRTTRPNSDRDEPRGVLRLRPGYDDPANPEASSPTVTAAPDIEARSPRQWSAVGVAQARCYDPEWANTRLFFSERPIDIARAKVICGDCAVKESCLDGALERREPVGVWGGECFVNGRIVETRRPRGRPRKNPVP